ncbi:hypothetical protein [Prescottella equi]|uniref:Uncharacterized protein n=1 Tax=Rhodococcus hoagii TaxID=43767 RepID=A0AAE5IVR2_RHOHA|nr:hypothetical protein [Prescottella equi]ORM31283.1 hypothetical protein A5N68_03500 [Prescottella equi]BDC71052.1 hypothetical protein KAREA_09670 [Prescottella equi]
MNGAQHYAEAERLLALADGDVSENWPVQVGERKADILAAAQVHATLAQAAATIDAAPDCDRYESWRTATAGMDKS